VNWEDTQVLVEAEVAEVALTLPLAVTGLQVQVGQVTLTEEMEEAATWATMAEVEEEQ
tara:strand:- start:582 stop:755 length:174 start_codon:yes stop_codon:yes gene_type:complete